MYFFVNGRIVRALPVCDNDAAQIAGAQLGIHQRNPEVFAAYLHYLSVRSPRPVQPPATAYPYRPPSTVLRGPLVSSSAASPGTGRPLLYQPNPPIKPRPNLNVHCHPDSTERLSWMVRKPDIGHRSPSILPQPGGPRTSGPAVLVRPSVAPVSSTKAASIYCPDRVPRPTTPAYRGFAAPTNPAALWTGTATRFPLTPRVSPGSIGTSVA